MYLQERAPRASVFHCQCMLLRRIWARRSSKMRKTHLLEAGTPPPSSLSDILCTVELGFVDRASVSNVENASSRRRRWMTK